MDVHYHSIVNYLYNVMARCQEDTDRRRSTSNLDLSSLENESYTGFKVEVTRALNQFWFDEQSRREKLLGISDPISIVLDYSNNIESRPEVKRGEMDPFWMNFVDREDIKSLMKKYVKSYSQSGREESKQALFV